MKEGEGKDGTKAAGRHQECFRKALGMLQEGIKKKPGRNQEESGRHKVGIRKATGRHQECIKKKPGWHL